MEARVKMRMAEGVLGMPGHRSWIASTAVVSVVVAAALLFTDLHVLLSGSLCLALAVVWGIALGTYRMCGWRSKGGLWVIAAAYCVLAILMLLNLGVFTVWNGATVSSPHLENPDAWNVWQNMLVFLGRHDEVVNADTSQLNFGMLVAAEMKVFSGGAPNILVPLTINMLCTLLTITTCGSVAVKVLRGALPTRSPRWIALVAMAMMASVCYFLQMGALIIKEAMAIFAFALTIRCILGVYRPTSRREYTICIAGGIIALGLLTMTRVNYLWFSILALIVLFPYTLRPSANTRRAVVGGVVLFIAIGLLHYIATNLLTVAYLERVISPSVGSSYLNPEPHQQIWFDNVSGYDDMSVARKLLVLPFSALLQFFIPFPWNFMRHAAYGYSQVYAHFAYPWYIIGGIMGYYFFTLVLSPRKTLRRETNRALVAMTILGTLAWFAIAYITVGAVSRYALSFLVVLIPGAVYTVSEYACTKAFRRYAVVYVMLMAAALTTCYWLQANYIHP